MIEFSWEFHATNENFKRMKTIEKVRTPESAFTNLKDYPFTPNYMDLAGGVRLHYLDEGRENKKTIFLFHGQPSWSYLYRHMIPQLVAAGFRVIAPDLIGFGKSDKPVNSEDISFQAHVNWMSEFVKKLGITKAAAFMQDWGGMIGLRVLANNPAWLNRLVVANTALAEFKGLQKWLVPKMINRTIAKSGTPTLQNLDENMDYKNWVGYFKTSGKLEIGEVMQLLTTNDLSQEEKDAYDAPFPNENYYATPRKMPEIVATDLTAVNEDWESLKKWNHPVLTLFSDKDPFLADQGYDKKFQKNFKGAKGQPHITVSNASHFLQEDQTDMLVNRILDWLEQTKY
ncbi:alpha/beta fold hydrolase [Labilibacter sediminis]|nr:alpha/beta fold hydrolase [Labilibacter sediminis]